MIFCLIFLVVVVYSTGLYGTGLDMENGNNDLLQAGQGGMSYLGRVRGPFLWILRLAPSPVERTNGRNKQVNRLTRILKRYAMDKDTVHNDLLLDEHRNKWSEQGRSGAPSFKIIKMTPWVDWIPGKKRLLRISKRYDMDMYRMLKNHGDK